MSQSSAVINNTFCISKWKAAPDKELLVMAGNYGQFEAWLNENNLIPSNRLLRLKYNGKRIRYVSKPMDIIGTNPKDYYLVAVGEYWKSPLYNEKTEIEIRGLTMYVI